MACTILVRHLINAIWLAPSSWSRVLSSLMVAKGEWSDYEKGSEERDQIESAHVQSVNHS